ncbi:hypothetical protein QYE76_019266 [Lolium multiflorum]|uniref:CCHC-type domain-containing protein n=1 Tax=Lolium multiflorum TaxID=4521 RepID=A0AAD8R5E7_LOLMU|nr:hypothetical protein QYE76_019266 [Lolium multiflorum]
MERDRRGKRPYEEMSGEPGWRRDQDLRQKMDREQEEHRRQQRERDREFQRRRDADGRSQERRDRDRRSPPPPPSSRGRESSGAAARAQGPARGWREGSARSATEGTAPNSADVSHIICYNCGKQGHFQADCKEEAFCVKCNKPGHVSAMCAALRNVTETFWAGYGVDGTGFTCCEESLRMAIRVGGVTLPSSKLHIIVTTSSGDPAVVEQLKEIWIKIFDVPPPYRQAIRILLATRQLGRPIAVDEGSLESPLEPVRVLFGCKTPVRLPPYIMLFVNSQGFKVRVLPEQEPEGPKDNPPPPPRQQFDDKDEDIEESEGEGWDGCRGKHNRKNKEPAKGTSGDASEPKRKSVPMGPSEQVTKLPDSAMNQYGSNLTDSGDIFPALAKIVSAASTKQTSPQRSGESGEMVDSDGNQPPTSPSLATDSATPEGGPTSVRMSLWKAQPMSSMDREEAGITSPSWESDPDTIA